MTDRDWQDIRETYNEVLDLITTLNRLLGPLIVVSYMAGLWFICGGILLLLAGYTFPQLKTGKKFDCVHCPRNLDVTRPCIPQRSRPQEDSLRFTIHELLVCADRAVHAGHVLRVRAEHGYSPPSLRGAVVPVRPRGQLGADLKRVRKKGVGLTDRPSPSTS